VDALRSLESLDLSHAALRPEDAWALAEAVKKGPLRQLQALALANNVLGDEAVAQARGQALVSDPSRGPMVMKSLGSRSSVYHLPS
jgi:hypothetical protein